MLGVGVYYYYYYYYIHSSGSIIHTSELFHVAVHPWRQQATGAALRQLLAGAPEAAATHGSCVSGRH